MNLDDIDFSVYNEGSLLSQSVMIVSTLQMILDLPDLGSLKDKRRIIKSLKDKLQNKFKLSVAEIGMHDSLSMSHIGAAIVSNSKKHGESVLHKALDFAEDEVPGRIYDVSISSFGE